MLFLFLSVVLLPFKDDAIHPFFGCKINKKLCNIQMFPSLFVFCFIFFDLYQTLITVA